MSFISEADTFLFSEEGNYAKEAFWKHQSLNLAGLNSHFLSRQNILVFSKRSVSKDEGHINNM